MMMLAEWRSISEPEVRPHEVVEALRRFFLFSERVCNESLVALALGAGDFEVFDAEAADFLESKLVSGVTVDDSVVLLQRAFEARLARWRAAGFVKRDGSPSSLMRVWVALDMLHRGVSVEGVADSMIDNDLQAVGDGSAVLTARNAINILSPVWVTHERQGSWVVSREQHDKLWSLERE